MTVCLKHTTQSKLSWMVVLGELSRSHSESQENTLKMNPLFNPVSSLRTESIQKHEEQSSYKKTPQKNMLHNTHDIMLMTSSMKSL